MINSPPVGTYDPNDTYIRTSISKGIKLDNSLSRFDEYSFKKKIANSPTNAFYDVKDPRELSFVDKHKHQNVAFFFTFC